MSTRICAHRGASAYHPDNSLAAFEAAIAMGADLIETDVRRGPDGRLVLAHDPLPPGEDGAGLVDLPTLVALAAGRIALDVELKEAGCEADVLAALRPLPPGLVVTSFLPDVVARLRALDADVALGLLVDEDDGDGDLLARAAACGAGFVAPHVSLADADLRRRALAAGQPLSVWTVNDPRTLADVLHDPAIDLVCTDVPDVAAALRDRR